MNLRTLSTLYGNGFRPSAELCEREILGCWFTLAEEVERGAGDSLFARTQANLLHDYAQLRAQALGRPSAAQ